MKSTKFGENLNGMGGGGREGVVNNLPLFKSLVMSIMMILFSYSSHIVCMQHIPHPLIVKKRGLIGALLAAGQSLFLTMENYSLLYYNYIHLSNIKLNCNLLNIYFIYVNTDFVSNENCHQYNRTQTNICVGGTRNYLDLDQLPKLYHYL